MAIPQCPRCARDITPDAAFCMGCGLPLAAAKTVPAAPSTPARRAERRQVTVLFCDLVESVSLSLTLDPEDMMHVLDVFQASCDDIIAQHGGYLAKYMGDGVLAYYGYPRANEEDAANAIRAALDLRAAIRRLDLPRQISLQSRVAIATGLVVINDLVSRGTVLEAGVVGETPNLAARLQAITPADGIVMAEATRRITEGQFVYRPIGSVTLKGFTRPIEAFEVVGPTEAGNRSRARAQRAEAPLVGRERELGMLLAAWERTRASKGQVVLLQGEPGIGKSRLTEALRAHVADTQRVQLTWFCGPNSSASALYPVIEQLVHNAGFERGEPADARRAKLARLLTRYGVTAPLSAEVIADLLGLPPDVDQPPEALTPEKRKEVTMDTLLAIVDGWASSNRVLLVAEDLHWADSTTLELLDLLVGRAADRPWLILATARSEFQVGWAGRANFSLIELARLNQGNAERICMDMGANAVLPPEAIRQIVARCDGIPLFIEEMTKAVLEGMATASTREGARMVVIPATLHDSLEARLDRLGPARRVASLGATIGRRFSYELLAAVAAQPASELREALRELTQSGLVERRGLPPHSTYQFKHALIRDAAYESLLKREREALHGQIARVLRDRFPELRDSEPELLAHHLTESGATTEAIPLWAAAGQRAASRAAHVEAVGHLQTALELLRQQPADGARAVAELPLLLGLAVSLSASRGYSVPEVGQLLREARTICDSMNDADGLFWILRALFSFLNVAGDLEEAEEMGQRCAAIAARTGMPEHLLESACPLGHIRWARGKLMAARENLEDVERLYAKHNGATLTLQTPQDSLIAVLSVLPLVNHALGDTVGAERAAAALHSHVAMLGRPFDSAYGLYWHALYYWIAGNTASASRFVQESLEISEPNGYSTWRAIALALNAVIIGNVGDHDQGVDLLHRALSEWERLGITHTRSYYIGELARLELRAGDAASALSKVDEAIAHAIRFDDRYFLPILFRYKAEILQLHPTADRGAVQAALREALAISEAQGAIGFAGELERLLDSEITAS
jgi:class 3 adenylate cyclase/tetratricopeptide (TPR) repeat protein